MDDFDRGKEAAEEAVERSGGNTLHEGTGIFGNPMFEQEFQDGYAEGLKEAEEN
jgi:hypothetical protein